MSIINSSCQDRLLTHPLTIFLILLSHLALGQKLSLPQRPFNAPSGDAFAERITSLALPERENEIVSQILSGNVPDFLRQLCPVSVTNVVPGKTNIGTFYATPDYLAVGSDTDYFLVPISPRTGQRIADALNCSLPTRK